MKKSTETNAAALLAAAREATKAAEKGLEEAEKRFASCEASEVPDARDQRDIAQRKLETARRLEAETEKAHAMARARELEAALDVGSLFANLDRIGAERARIEEDFALLAMKHNEAMAEIDALMRATVDTFNGRVTEAQALASKLGQAQPKASTVHRRIGYARALVIKHDRAVKAGSPRDDAALLAGVASTLGVTPYGAPHERALGRDVGFTDRAQVEAMIDGTFSARVLDLEGAREARRQHAQRAYRKDQAHKSLARIASRGERVRMAEDLANSIGGGCTAEELLPTDEELMVQPYAESEAPMFN